MNIRDRRARDRELYRFKNTHTAMEAAIKFKLSMNQVFLIKKNLETRVAGLVSSDGISHAAEITGFTPEEIQVMVESFTARYGSLRKISKDRSGRVEYPEEKL